MIVLRCTKSLSILLSLTSSRAVTVGPMEFRVPTPHEHAHGSRALLTVALASAGALAEGDRHELSDPARSLLRASHRLLGPGGEFDIDALTTISAAELAAAVHGAALRYQLVGALIIMAMASGEVTPAGAQAVATFATALEVDSSAIANITRLAEAQFLRARLDILRRQWAPKKLGELAARDGFGVIPKAIMTLIGATDSALSSRYIELGKCDPGTLGRAYFDYMIRNDLAFPGERGSPPEVILFHDMTHVLSGYDTTPTEEILAASFSAGYSGDEVHNWLVFVLSQFQLGLQTAPKVPPERLMMDPERLILAVRRGAAMNIDINHNWDYWDVIDEPLEALRQRYNILPESAFVPHRSG